ncbi:MAG: rhodanese-like domain-containing protein [Minicystis sp.]
MLRSTEELAALFAKAGVKPDDGVIGYCHVGQQATAMLFAARRLGHDVRLYDGSFEDWSLYHPDYPVEDPSRKAQR